MTLTTVLKLGQIAGALLMAAGVAACQLRDDSRATPLLFLAGGLLIAVCRLTGWLRSKGQ